MYISKEPGEIFRQVRLKTTEYKKKHYPFRILIINQNNVCVHTHITLLVYDQNIEVVSYIYDGLSRLFRCARDQQPIVLLLLIADLVTNF